MSCDPYTFVHILLPWLAYVLIGNKGVRWWGSPLCTFVCGLALYVLGSHLCCEKKGDIDPPGDLSWYGSRKPKWLSYRALVTQATVQTRSFSCLDNETVLLWHDINLHVWWNLLNTTFKELIRTFVLIEFHVNRITISIKNKVR